MSASPLTSVVPVSVLVQLRGIDGKLPDVLEDAKALGYDPAAVYTEHPIQDRTDAEMKEISDSVFDRILAGLVADSD